MLSSLTFFGQNTFPTTGNVTLDGSYINLIMPETTGGWARGFLNIGKDKSTRLGGVGLLGSKETPSYYYMAHGTSPWSSELGIYVKTNGNTGIGITNPSEKLDIKGNVKATGNVTLDGSYINLVMPETTGGWARGFFNIGKDKSTRLGGVGLLGSKETPSHYYMAHGTSPWSSGLGVYVKTNGNVGVGTTKPDSKLTVKGKIHCEEVLVDLEVPADYVFEKYYTGGSNLKEDYKMPTLEEVEKFTKENHHLPNVPSAKKIQEEGLKLKEMTNLLLQKIEELTLYTIEQEKRIKALEGKLVEKK